MKKKGLIFLTGGSGFIGNYILKDLKKKKIKVCATYFKNKIKKTKYVNPVKINLNRIKKKILINTKLKN